MNWHRNAGPRRTRYHMERADWIRSGLAVCGATIARPAFTADTVQDIIRACRKACAKCEAISRKGK